MNKRGQMGFIMVVAGLLLLLLSVIVFSLLSPITGEFIEMGRNSSEAHGDTATSFIISLFPVWIIILLLGSAAYIIARGGG